MPLLKRGSRGEDVRRLQEALKRLGFDPGPIDGIFGPKTEAAVKAFQKKYGLVVDGIVGPQTWAKINELLNSRSSSSTGSGTTGGTSGSSGAHKAMSDYENEIWGDPFVPERAQSRHYKPFFYSGEYSKALQETGFDIYIVYGPLPYDVEKRGNTLPGMVSYNTTVKAIRGVQLTGCTQVLDPTGKPIEEVYEFIARDID
jgi:peptidoglycan hydrolase-like protein with peptidoglycan-binding domain